MRHKAGNHGEVSTAPARLTRADGRFVIPAELIATRFRLAPSDVAALMRAGQITSKTEKGTGTDAGRWRLTLYFGDQAMRLTVDDAGKILKQASFAAPRRGMSPK